MKGVRTGKEFDIDTLADTITKFSALCIESSDVFEEIDINPLVLIAKG